MEIQPYLFFNGQCDQAIAYYTEILGAQLIEKHTYADAPPGSSSPDCPTPPSHLIMHAMLKIGDSIVLVSDGRGEGAMKFDGFFLTLLVHDVQQGRKLHQAILNQGKELMPYMPTFYSPGFGMVTDRFGVGWMIYTKPSDQK